MAIVKRSDRLPFFRSALSDLLHTDAFFDHDFFRKDLFPAVNVEETDNAFALEMAVPGLKKEDFRIEVENGVLTVSGESKQEKEEKDKKYTRKEFSYSSFSRSFTLPENTSEEDITAAYNDGILKLTIAKKTRQTAQKKAISVG